MSIKWITALSMFWGAWCLLDAIRVSFGWGTPKDPRTMGMSILAGIPAWAWLIARYLL